jgi:hypothetical protein
MLNLLVLFAQLVYLVLCKPRHLMIDSILYETDKYYFFIRNFIFIKLKKIILNLKLYFSFKNLGEFSLASFCLIQKLIKIEKKLISSNK